MTGTAKKLQVLKSAVASNALINDQSKIETALGASLGAASPAGGTAAALLQSDSSWDTLPGSTASVSRESGQITDTILGAGFDSTQVGLISWSYSGEAFYKGFAGIRRRSWYRVRRSALVVCGAPTSTSRVILAYTSSSQIRVKILILELDTGIGFGRFRRHNRVRGLSQRYHHCHSSV